MKVTRQEKVEAVAKAFMDEGQVYAGEPLEVVAEEVSKLSDDVINCVYMLCCDPVFDHDK